MKFALLFRPLKISNIISQHSKTMHQFQVECMTSKFVMFLASTLRLLQPRSQGLRGETVTKTLVKFQPRSQGLRGETVTKTLAKFVLSFQNFGKKIACAVRHNRIAIQLNTVVSHCACDFFPKILER